MTRRYMRARAVLIMVAALIIVFGASIALAHAAEEPTLNKSKVTMFLGSSTTLKVKNAPKKATVTYKSSKKSVVAVTKKGKLTAKKKGKAKITVTIKNGATKTKLTCDVKVKKAVVAVLDGGASKGVKVTKALTVTDGGPRGPKGGHADKQIANIKKEAPKASIISIRVTDKDEMIYGSYIPDAIDLAIENKADIIYFSFYAPQGYDEMYAAIQRAADAGIKMVGPAGNDKGEDAREKNFMTEMETVTVVGAWGTNSIAKFSNIHANVYVKAGSTSAAAARYAGMLAAGKVYGAHYEK